jgi:hypothetical protein
MPPSIRRLPCAYQLGTIVYKRLDTDGTKGMIVDITFRADGGVLYGVAWNEVGDTDHYEIELSTVPHYNDPAEVSDDTKEDAETETG